jgi:RNA recognition motif-containing protein
MTQVFKLLLSNLSYFTTESDLQTKFSEFGPVVEVQLAKDRNGLSKGRAVVIFGDKTSIDTAILALQVEPIDDRVVHWELSVPPDESAPATPDPAPLASAPSLDPTPPAAPPAPPAPPPPPPPAAQSRPTAASASRASPPHAREGSRVREPPKDHERHREPDRSRERDRRDHDRSREYDRRREQEYERDRDRDHERSRRRPR